jgi:hypothetical protein
MSAQTQFYLVAVPAVIILIVQDWVSVWAFRRDFSSRNLIILIPASMIGVALGWLLAARVSDDAVRLAVGLISIVFAVYMLIRDRLGRAPVAKPGVAPLILAISTSRRLPWRWRRRGCASTRLHGRRGACLRAAWPNGRSATSLGRFVRLCLQFWIELLSRSICMIRFWPSADTALKRRRPQRHPRSERPLALKGAIPVTSGQTSFRSNCAGADKTHLVI